MEAFTMSFQDGSSYPRNLLEASDFPYITESYVSQLDENEDCVFALQKGKLILQDLVRSPTGSYEYARPYEAEGDGDLDAALSLDKPDPRRRFCFIRSASSRGKLMCSRAQLSRVLSRYQAMPEFLNFVFTFELREEPHNLTSFRYKDNISPLCLEPRIDSLQKSGARIQHCFNILGMERDERNPEEWKPRQVAAYHSFDVLNGNTFWIILKGNATMQQRMQQAAGASLKNYPHFPKSTHGSLQQALQEHLLLLRWGTESWVQYLGSLEETCVEYTKITRYPHIQELVDDTPIRRIRSWNTVSETQPKPLPKRSSTLKAIGRRTLQFIEPSVRRASYAMASLSRNNTGLSAQTQKMDLNDDTLELDDLVSFEGLQSLNSVTGELRAAASLIDQNKRVITDIRDRYIELGESALFEMHLQNEEFKRCRDVIHDFTRQIRHFEGDLDSFQGRLKSIMHRAEQGSEMYNHIFQARNTRVAEFLARAAQDSAEEMQKCTEQMHLKTMSMHVITVFTLIFLPGTFVAVRNIGKIADPNHPKNVLLILSEVQTIFSSGIISFGNEGSSGFGPNLGDWKVRTAGIKLFFTICLPLLACTFGWWLLAYLRFWSRTKSAIERCLEKGNVQELPKCTQKY